MNGFTIKHNDEELHIALPTGGVMLLISNKEGKLNIHCQGMDRNATFYSWHGEELKMGDTVPFAMANRIRRPFPNPSTNTRGRAR